MNNGEHKEDRKDSNPDLCQTNTHVATIVHTDILNITYRLFFVKSRAGDNLSDRLSTRVSIKNHLGRAKDTGAVAQGGGLN